MLTQPAPFIPALVAALLVTVAAWRLRSLTIDGAAVATLIGVVAMSVSVGAGLYLISWFVLASLVSRIGRQQKALRTRSIVDKGGRRDAFQVLANGGAFLVCVAYQLPIVSVCGSLADCSDLWMVAAAGSLAAAGADTWATEIGTLFGGQPYSLRGRRAVAAGTSGAVSLQGTAGMVFAACLYALLAALAIVPMQSQYLVAIATGGIAGAVIDTLIGAWFQERRQCQSCGMFTEQLVHVCGGRTAQYSGLSGLNNDAVNAICALSGAVVAVLTLLL